jgi:hypothetical protein
MRRAGLFYADPLSVVDDPVFGGARETALEIRVATHDGGAAFTGN